MNPSLYSCCFLLLVPGLVALPDIEIQQGRRLYTGYKVLRAHLTSDTDRAAVLQLEDGKLEQAWSLRKCKEVKLLVRVLQCRERSSLLSLTVKQNKQLARD